MSFLPKGFSDYGNPQLNGTRIDNRNLIAEWQAKMTRESKRFKFIWNASDFRSTDFKEYDHVLG